MLLQRKMLYSFGDQNLIFPVKNALGLTDRDNHNDRYSHKLWVSL